MEKKEKLYGISRRIYDKSGSEIIFSYGKGCYVYDTNQKQYIDMILGYGPMILGHGNEEYAEAIRKCILAGTTFPSYGKLQIDLAQCLQEFYPKHQLITVHQSGSDTLEAAIKVCRKIQNKKKFIRYGYVGWHEQLLSNGLNWHEPINSSKYNKYAEIKETGDRYAVNWNGVDINEFEQLCSQEDIACFVVDAYQIKRRSDRDFHHVLEICKRKNILVVLDETKTAGRVTPFGYYKEEYDFDFTVLGKAIGNGVPVSLLLAHKQYKELPYDSYKIAGTYARDLLGCQAILTTYDIMKQKQGFQTISKTGKVIACKMNHYLKNIIGTEAMEVNDLLDGGILEFTYSNEIANDEKKRNIIYTSLLEKGIILPNGHCFYICTEHQGAIEHLIENFEKAMNSAWLMF